MYSEDTEGQVSRYAPPLRVAKAMPYDVGHGRVRVPLHLCPFLLPGDIVSIRIEFESIGDMLDAYEADKPDQTTSGIVWRCRPEDNELGVIRMDGIIRKNAGVSLGDRVTLTKVEPQPCELLVISPCTERHQKVTFERDVSGFVRRGLNKRPFVVGDRVFVPGMTLLGEALPFEVVDTLPEDETVRVTSDTEIIVLDHDPSCPECEEDSEDVQDESNSEDYDGDADVSDPELILGVAIPVGEDFSVDNDGLMLTLKHLEDGTMLLSLMRSNQSEIEASDRTHVG